MQLDSQFVVENRSRSRSYTTAIEATEMHNYASTRVARVCHDTLPPQHRQLLCAYTPLHQHVVGSVHYHMKFDTLATPIPDTPPHDPPLSVGDMHAPSLICAGDAASQKHQKTDPYAEWTGGYTRIVRGVALCCRRKCQIESGLPFNTPALEVLACVR